MGCKQSKIDQNRGNFMKEAVSARNAFAAALSGYAIALKNTGAALSDYTQGVAPPPAAAGPPSDPPPKSPLLPTLSPAPMAMGPLPPRPMSVRTRNPRPRLDNVKGIPWDFFTTDYAGVMEEESEDEDSCFVMDEQETDCVGKTVPSPSWGGVEEETVKDEGSSWFDDDNDIEVEFKDMSKILREVEDQFLKASASLHEVSKLMTGAPGMDDHSSFSDNRGFVHTDYASRVMKLITWSNLPNGDPADGDGDETHATVLDKLLVWEKKLSEELKAFKPVQHEYKSLVDAKADVSQLRPLYVLNKQLLESTLLEMKSICDKQLYPQLVAIVNGMARMWESMLMHHTNQMNIAANGLKSLHVAGVAPLETSKYHRDRTRELFKVVEEWPSHLDMLVGSQKQYIHCLNRWLKKINLVSIQASSQERAVYPPIQPLLQNWHDHLVKLPHEVAKSAISSFAADLKAILDLQEEEMELKEKWEETKREYTRKNQAFEEWYPNRGEDTNPQEHGAESEKLVVEVDSLKKRMEDEMEDHYKLCIQLRELSVGSLENGLPELFRVMSGYAHACFDAYHSLRLLAESPNQK